MRERKTDYGTIILHWLLVGAFGVALFTGLRIATETPDRLWINLFDAVLPQQSVWVRHMQAAVILIAVALGYAVYMIRSGLVRRIRLDGVRLRGLFGRREARLGAANVFLCWVFFIAMLLLMASGGALYFGILAGHDAAALHWYSTWAILAFAALHILTHFKIAGLSQLLRIVRPTVLPAPPKELDAVELLAMLAEQSAEPAHHIAPSPDVTMQPHSAVHRSNGAARKHGDAKPRVARAQAPAERGRPKRQRHATFQANPLVVAAAVAITGTSFILAADRLNVDHLEIRRIDTAIAPVLDGDTSDRAWRKAVPFFVTTTSGGNFEGKGETRVEIRAVHDENWAYFLFIWEDPTRSLKHIPLVKEADGWRVLHDGLESGDEREFNEDKFSVLFTAADVTIAGDRTFHAGPHPIAGAPETMSGRGLHFSTAGYADVWEWKATSGSTGWMDDAHFGPPLEPTPMQARHVVPYKGGFAPDPGAVNYSDNFAIEEDVRGGRRFIAPLRLPKDLAAVTAAMGHVDFDQNHGDEDGSRWFMTESESVPYSAAEDARIPVGTTIPGVIISGEFAGDRADVRCAARWASGRWALEVARRLDTGSAYDVPIKTGVFMRVAAFDHSEIRHTRHVRPIRLEVE
jgi:ethylbenzene dehydrogenase/cytochrome b561-like protein